MSGSLLIILQSWDDVYQSASTLRYSVENLCFILCALSGLIGSIRIYNKWQLNNRCWHLDAEIVGWFGATLFFLTATTLIDKVF
ncbi:MAG TPA: DUF4134 family protein [Segetibacter sp.]|jgi:hypothetical protein